jgi:hypothetical protein
MKCFNRALEIDSHCVASLKNKGLTLMMLNAGTDAIACFNTCLNLDPLCGDAWIAKGNLV